MTPRDRSAERMVASTHSQNQPDDLFTAAEKDKAHDRSRLPAAFIEAASTAPGSETSARAADAIASARFPKAYLIYQHIKSMGRHGATRQEIADALGLPLQTICSLTRRLYQMGLVGSNPAHVRLNRFSGLENEVMLHEDYVTRWNEGQARPPQIPKWMVKQ